MCDSEQFSSLLIRNIDYLNGMVIKPSNTSGFDAFVAVDDRPILSNDGETLGVLIAIARLDDIILGFEIQIVVGERPELVDRAPFDALLWFDDLDDIWCADEDASKFLRIVDGDVMHDDTPSAVMDTFDPSLVGSPLSDDTGVLAL